MLADETSKPPQEWMKQIASLEARLQVSQQLTEFLQANLANLEQEKLESEKALEETKQNAAAMGMGLEEKVAGQSFHLTESQRMIQFYKQLYEKAAEEKSQWEGRAVQAEYRATEATRLVKFLQTKVGKLQSETSLEFEKLQNRAHANEFRLAETERVLKFVQSMLEKTKHQANSSENTLEQRISEQRFRLTESKRIMKVYEDRYTRVVHEKSDVETKLAQSEFRTMEANRVVKYLHSALGKMQGEKEKKEQEIRQLAAKLNQLAAEIETRDMQVQAQQQQVDTLQKSLISMESRVAVDHRVGSFLHETLSKTQDALSQSQLRCSELENQLSTKERELAMAREESFDVAFKLTGTQRVLQFLHTNLEKAKFDKDTMECALTDKLAQAQFQLTESRRVLTFLQNSLSKIKAEKHSMENDGAIRIAKLDFELCESKRMIRFLQMNASRVSDEKRKAESKAHDLEKLVNELRQDLKEKADTLESNDHHNNERSIVISDLQKRLADANSKYAVLNRMVEYLQEGIARMEFSKRLIEETLSEKENQLRCQENTISDLQFRLVESARMTKFLEQKLSKPISWLMGVSYQYAWEVKVCKIVPRQT